MVLSMVICFYQPINRNPLKERSMETTTGLIVKILGPLIGIILVILGIVSYCYQEDRKDTEAADNTATTVV